MMDHAHKLDVVTRAKALEAGQWQKADGSFVALADMVDEHLLNALLKALADQEPDGITHPLAAEVIRRGLEQKAMDWADARELWRTA